MLRITHDFVKGIPLTGFVDKKHATLAELTCRFISTENTNRSKIKQTQITQQIKSISKYTTNHKDLNFSQKNKNPDAEFPQKITENT